MQRTPTHAMPALRANNGAFPISSGIHPRMAWIHVPTRVDTHQQQRGRHPPRAAHAVATDRGNPRSPSTAPSREVRFHSRLAFIHAWRGSTCRPRSTPTNSSVVDTRQQPRADQRSAPTNSSGNLSKAGWVRLRGALPCAQDSAHEQAATELTGVRALCLRSTASQAPERTAASGWAGPRRGTCSVPRNRTHPAIPRNARFCRCRCRCR
ncbi:hypothetical protein SAMN05720615_102254 [Stenotrophomonas indicatrix]|nr:hypothetical protein SAMN05720615_102254 [Stenotrophomonas indicatrix]